MKRIAFLLLSTICSLSLFAKTSILGEMQITDPNVLYSFVKTTSPNTTCELEIAKQFIEVGRKYGIRGDIAFCQSIIETGWFKYEGSAVTPDQHNYCGLGVTSNGKKGESFNTIKDGVTAQIQHLYAYCCKKSLPYGETLIDPRFEYVTRGIAPNWEDLDGRWATGGGYSSKILNMYSQLQNYTSLDFTEYWNLSEQKGNKTSKGYDASKIRNMAYANGKLYAVYDHNKIIVIKAQTGDYLGELNDFNIDGAGVLKYCDVQTVGNKVVACNLSNGTTPFRIYVWDDDTKLPRILLETTDLGGVNRMGDCFNIWRDLNNGTIYLGHDDGSNTRIFEYRITNGVCGTSPNIIKATTNGKHMDIGTSCRVIPQSTGYWINGKNSDLIRTDNYGSETFRVPYDVKWGNAFTAFEYRGKSYGAITTFNKPDGVAAHNYTGGRFALLDPYNGWSKSTVIVELPIGGLGNSSQNINCTGSVIANVCNGGKGLEMWVLSTSHGMAYLYTGSCPWDQNVNPIAPIVTSSAITSSASKVDLTASVGTSAKTIIKVSGKDLNSDIKLSIEGTNADLFSLSSYTISKSEKTKDITVTYSPNSLGNHSASLKIESYYSNTLNIPLTGNAVDVKLNVSESVLYFNSQVNKTQEKEITISGKNLIDDIKLSLTGSNKNLFFLSENKITKAEASKTITVTYNPTFEGYHYANIEIETFGNFITIPLNGQANSDTHPVNYFSTDWCYSAVQGNSTDWINPNKALTRNMVINGNNLYVVQRTNQIFIVDAYSGLSKGLLKTSGITTTDYGFFSVANLGGTIVACDLADSGTKELHVYAWSGDNADPKLILNTTNHGNIRIGDLMGASGNINNGKLWFGGKDGNIYIYSVTNGKASASQKTISLKDEISNIINLSGGFSVVGFHVNEDGTFWASGKDDAPMLFSSEGKLIKKLDVETLNGSIHGTSFFPFGIADRKYAIANVYKKGTVTEGRLNFIDIRNGVEHAHHIHSFPVLGNAGTANGTFVTSAFAVVDKMQNTAHLWTLIPNQGAAKYTIKGIATDVEENFAEKAEISVTNGTISVNGENAVIDLISINGMRVAHSENSILDINDVQKGIYVVVATLENGERITKKIAIM